MKKIATTIAITAVLLTGCTTIPVPEAVDAPTAVAEQVAEIVAPVVELRQVQTKVGTVAKPVEVVPVVPVAPKTPVKPVQPVQPVEQVQGPVQPVEQVVAPPVAVATWQHGVLSSKGLSARIVVTDDPAINCGGVGGGCTRGLGSGTIILSPTAGNHVIFHEYAHAVLGVLDECQAEEYAWYQTGDRSLASYPQCLYKNR